MLRNGGGRWLGLMCAFALLAALGAAPAVATHTPPPALPDPGGDENANVPIPPPSGKYLGMNDDTTAPGTGYAAQDWISLTQTMGGNAIRGLLDWRRIERQRNQDTDVTWDPYTAFYNQALTAELTPIFILAFAPCWAREAVYALACLTQPVPAGGEYPPARSFNGEWLQFAAEAARRYPAAIFEIWNEPNLPEYWESGPDPQRFAELQAIAYDAIKSVRPNALVLAGGFASEDVTVPGGKIAQYEFVKRAYAATPSIKGKMDAISFHPYPNDPDLSGPGPHPPLGMNSKFARDFHDIRTAQAEANDEGSELFLTETGLSIGHTVPNEALQSDGNLRVYRKTMTMDDVIGVVFHRIIARADLGFPEPGFAWLLPGPPLDPRTVFCTFTGLAGNSYTGCP